MAVPQSATNIVALTAAAAIRLIRTVRQKFRAKDLLGGTYEVIDAIMYMNRDLLHIRMNMRDEDGATVHINIDESGSLEGKICLYVNRQKGGICSSAWLVGRYEKLLDAPPSQPVELITYKIHMPS
jgi:hypothetical protein